MNQNNASQNMEIRNDDPRWMPDQEQKIFDCYLCDEIIDESQEVWILCNPKSKLTQPCCPECATEFNV